MHPVIEEDLANIIALDLDWIRFRNKTVLVTGAAGMLASYMVETLLMLNRSHGLGCRVVGLVRTPEKAKKRFADHLQDPFLTFVHADVSVGIPVSHRCDFIIHAASHASPKYFGSDPVGTMSSNLNGTWHALCLAREWSSEGFLFFSSSEVYGQAIKTPTREDDYGWLDILAPRSCYAESKRAAETLAVSFACQHAVPATIVRPYHSYGPGMALDDGRVFADLVRNIIEGGSLVLHSDGSSRRAFCYISDAVSGFFTVLLKGQPGRAYNVGNPGGVLSIRELAELLVRCFPERGLKVEFQNTMPTGYLASQVKASTPDIQRLSGLGWLPRVDTAEGFRRTIRFFLG